MDEERKSIYIETTIPSYATARENRDILIAGRQLLTRFFWEQERHKYDLYVSQLVMEECSDGDPSAARKRLDFISGIDVLPTTAEAEDLGKTYEQLLQIPERARTDCLHLSICVLNGMDFLVTWNCTHLGIVSNMRIYDYNEKHGLWTPMLVTPEYFVDFTGEV